MTRFMCLFFGSKRIQDFFYSWFYVCVVGVVQRASHVQSITAGTPTTPNSINYRHTTISGGDVELSYACYEDKDDVEKVQIDFSSLARSLKTSNGFPAHTLTNERRKKGVEKWKKKFLYLLLIVKVSRWIDIRKLLFNSLMRVRALVCHESNVKFVSRKFLLLPCSTHLTPFSGEFDVFQSVAMALLKILKD